jgi:hypothetical protein
MGFIHHTTGAAGATGLMAESARTRGSAGFGHPPLLATDLPARSGSAARIGGRPLCNADRAAAAGESQTGREATRPIPATRFRIVKGQHH